MNADDDVADDWQMMKSLADLQEGDGTEGRKKTVSVSAGSSASARPKKTSKVKVEAIKKTGKATPTKLKKDKKGTSICHCIRLCETYSFQHVIFSQSNLYLLVTLALHATQPTPVLRVQLTRMHSEARCRCLHLCSSFWAREASSPGPKSQS